MLMKMMKKKASLFSLSMLVITVSIIFLGFGYILDVSVSFLMGFATSTMLIGFGTMLASFIIKFKTGKIPETKYDERDKLISYISGFASYIITLFASCIFLFILKSPLLTYSLPADRILVTSILFMSISYWISVLVFNKIL